MDMPMNTMLAVGLDFAKDMAKKWWDKSGKKATAKFARRRADKLRRKRDEKNGIDNSGNA